jgi:hypothetical protein
MQTQWSKANTIELKNKIKKYQSFDQYIAKKNNTVEAYEKFWAPIYILSWIKKVKQLYMIGTRIHFLQY